MKNKAKASLPPRPQPTEDEIRDYAYHLYQQSGCAAGHDAENWLEAKACLEANIPKQHARARLHRHRHSELAETIVVAIDAPSGSLLDPLEDDLDDSVQVERVVVLRAPDR